MAQRLPLDMFNCSFSQQVGIQQILTCRKPPAAPPWMEAAPSGVGAPACPVLEKNEVKDPCFPKKFLQSRMRLMGALQGMLDSVKDTFDVQHVKKCRTAVVGTPTR